jgi:hypothetical protein
MFSIVEGRQVCACRPFSLEVGRMAAYTDQTIPWPLDQRVKRPFTYGIATGNPLGRNYAVSRRLVPRVPSPRQLASIETMRFTSAMLYSFTEDDLSSYAYFYTRPGLWNVHRVMTLGEPPSVRYSSSSNITGKSFTTLSAVAIAHGVSLTFSVSSAANLFCVGISRGTAPLVDVPLGNTIRFFPLTDTAEHTWIDSPLRPGTYFYRLSVIDRNNARSVYCPDVSISVP